MSVSASFWGMVDDAPYWNGAVKLYHEDKLPEAYELASAVGMGSAGRHLSFYRLIESEWITRSNSQVVEVNEWFSFEFMSAEVDTTLAGDLIGLAVEACNQAASRIGFRHGPKTLLTVLSGDSTIQWTSSPYGYCVDKYPYEKICLPSRLRKDPALFFMAVVHEYAHVATINMGQGHCPRWLSEAISVHLAGQIDEAIRRRFQTGEETWLKPMELEVALGHLPNNQAEAEAQDVAYQEAGMIGNYLASVKPEKALGDMLIAIGDESLKSNLSSMLLARGRADAALRKVYDISETKLFQRANEFEGVAKALHS